MVRETASKPPQTANINGCSKKAGTSGLNDGSMDIYDSEAAQNAFFNAPKISRRQFVNKRVSKKGGNGAGTDDEGEETEQPYDENNDQELNARIAGFMKEFISKKINANNAFETQILEKLNNVVEVESLQCVGAMLDASARVYAFRVDNTHGECFTVRTTIDESVQKEKRPTTDDARNMTSIEENGEAANNPDEEGDPQDDDDEGGNAVAEENERLKKAKQKKARQKESKLAEQTGQVEDLLKRATSLTQRFAAICLPDESVDEESVIAGFDHYINEMDDLNTLRRVKIPFINEKAGNIDRTNEEYGIDDPIYHKVAKEFEEGCAQSFVNNEVLTNPDGCFLILHTNWKNDEPNIPPQPAAFSTKLDPIFEQLEGSLERALAPQPCNLTILQDFCEEDSDGGDNQSDEMRLLGRRSQAVKQTTQRQLPEPSTREPSIENDAETESVVSMTEEDKSRKAHEELAKFQMLLDDEDEQPVKRDPFDGENFFNNDFSGLLHPDARNPNYKRLLCTVFLMMMQLKRLLSKDLQEQLFNTIGPENRARLEIVLDTKDLTKKEGAKPGTQVNQPLDYFMTRFAPLIDSVWHATIKKASEDQLSKVGFNFGPKGLQRITMRLGASAMKSVTKRRRGPYVTPVKTPARTTPLGTPESRIISPQSMTNSSRLSTRRDQFSSARKKAVSRLKFPGAASTGKKNRRSAHHEISDEENVDVGMSPVSQVSRASETIAQSKSYIYFWARPREYPRVYLEQVLDEKDNPMQTADLLDMDDVLGLNEEARNKRITLTTVAEVDNSFNQSSDFGDLQLDVEENFNVPQEIEVIQLAEKTLENTDILNILNPRAESIAGELLDPDEPVVEAIVVNAGQDRNHKLKTILTGRGTKSTKKAMPSKPKRQRLDFQVLEEEEMNWDLESATPIERRKLDIVGSGSVKLADMYDPVDLVNRSLLYKRKSGY
uniref:Condensin complex subunit 2 n=1 Tax=Ditylenchus dipsaci TaxID=166011 RepID=A0A915EG21_9BILA